MENPVQTQGELASRKASPAGIRITALLIPKKAAKKKTIIITNQKKSQTLAELSNKIRKKQRL